MNVDETELRNKEVDEVQCVFVYFSAILRWRDRASREPSERRDELAKDQIPV